ncbi:MAG: glycosyltransferase family 4 protein [Beijerinckiaceae bacterium]|nr:glycosyltransferase family 4 protein [Beijerinckiaceae bacterium]
MAANLRRLYPKVRKIFVSHNACHIASNEIKHRNFLAPPHNLRVGMLSNLSREKGLDVALEVATRCRDRKLNITFMFAGPPIGPEAERLLAKAGKTLEGYAKITGPVINETKAEFFNSIDVFLFPTRYRFEAQPLVILEAMSYGLPVITTNRGYVKELVGSAGIVLELDENLPGKIVEQLENLLKTRESSVSTRIATRAHFEELRSRAAVQLAGLVTALFGAHRVDQSGPAPSPGCPDCDAKTVS